MRFWVYNFLIIFLGGFFGGFNRVFYCLRRFFAFFFFVLYGFDCIFYNVKPTSFLFST